MSARAVHLQSVMICYPVVCDIIFYMIRICHSIVILLICSCAITYLPTNTTSRSKVKVLFWKWFSNLSDMNPTVI